MSKEVDGQKNIKIAFTLNAKRIFFDHVHFYFPVVKMRKTFVVLWGTFSRKTWRYIGTFRPAPATGVSRAHSRKCRTQASITQTTKKVNTLILKVITWQIIVENGKKLWKQKTQHLPILFCRVVEAKTWDTSCFAQWVAGFTEQWEQRHDPRRWTTARFAH